MTDETFPQVYNVLDVEYYKAKDLRVYDPMFFAGCSKTIRLIITRKNMTTDEYVYINISKVKGITLSTNQLKPSLKATLLLSKDWVINNVPKMMEDIEEAKNGYDYPIAPDVLLINNNEKFRDNEGNVIDIETIGERTSKGIYFKVKDISRGFDMPLLRASLLNKNSEYYGKMHYKMFQKNKTENNDLNTNKILYLTYQGMLKVLFCSRTGRADAFVEWATDTLFTVHMGTEEQKVDMVSTIIGIPAKSLREVLRTSVMSVPCIYRFSLGKVVELREVMDISVDIPDDYIIIKYGYTSDLVSRTSDHIATYECINGVKLGLMNYVYIDPKYLSQAEVEIKEFFTDIEVPINYRTFKELVAINPHHEKQIKRQFKMLSTEYSGITTELQNKISKLETTYNTNMLEKTNYIALLTEQTNNKLKAMQSDAELLTEQTNNKLKAMQSDHEINLYKRELETNRLLHEMEKQNYELQIQLLQK
jgi:hypothetical protein